MVSRKTINTLLASAVALTVVGGMNAARADHHEGAATADMEKCYGVVKAGMNDCANAGGTHSCAGHADADSGTGEWINLPKGVCEKLSGGSLTPKTADAAAPAAEAEAASDAAHGHE